jgi:hypothetical protein
MTNKDVRLAVALALARTSRLVKVTKTKQRFTIRPTNLFALKLSDKRIGIDDKRMALFKKNLRRILPDAAQSIKRIPNRASMSVNQIVSLILSRPYVEIINLTLVMPPLGKGKRRVKVGGKKAGAGPKPNVKAQAKKSLATTKKGKRKIFAGPHLGRVMGSGGTGGDPGGGGSGGRRRRRVFYPKYKSARTMAKQARAGGSIVPTLPKWRPLPKWRRSPAARATKRVVSTGFALPQAPTKPLRKSLPLSCNRTYSFWFQVGAPVRGSIEEKPMPPPKKHLPSEPRLKVALFDFGTGIRITPGKDVGEIQLHDDGTATVVRQPVSLEGLSPASKIYEKRLFFPVQTSDAPGEFQLRCCVYYEQVLVQSRLIRVRVMRRPRATKQALRSAVDYTLSRTLSRPHISAMQPHRMSLMLNDNGNGTHGFRFFGEKEFKNDATFDGQELQNLIEQARDALRKASWGDIEPWRKEKDYLYARNHDLARLKNDLVSFAIWGYTFYDHTIDRFSGGLEQSDLLTEVMRTPGLVQIALKQSARQVLPAALIYDYPLDTNARKYDLCPEFLDVLGDDNPPLESSPCFQGNCPSREEAAVVCPSGFWGYRHSLGMPLSLKNSPDVPAEIVWQAQPELTVGVSTDSAFVLRAAHETALRSLKPSLGWNYGDTRAGVLQLLREKAPHVVYFYCHGGMSGTVPFILVGPPGDMGITRDNLRREKIRWKSPRPLVFINGCHTAALEPNVAIDFISGFVEVAGASGVIGTEITIFEPLARAFAEECLRRFLNGTQIGEAVRGARLKLLQAGNPLGLVYIPYVIASLRMTPDTQN